MHEFHFLGAVFAFLVLLMLLLGLLRPLPQAWQQEDCGELDLTPWRGAKAAGAVLTIIVITIYLAFAG